MVDAVKTWNKDHPEVTVVFAQGKSGTDDEGEIAAIESMISQGVKGIAITPTSPNLQTELQKAVDAGIKVVLVDNDIPAWTGKSSVVATDNLAGGKLAGTFLAQHLKPGAKLGVLQGVLGAPSLDQRVDGMLATLGSAATVVAKSPTDCDETKGLNAAQDMLTANPDLTGPLCRLRATHDGRAQGDRERQAPGRADHRRRLRCLVRRDRRDPRRHRARICGAVPGQDGVARDPDAARCGQRQDRLGQRRHRDRDGHQGQRGQLQVVRSTFLRG